MEDQSGGIAGYLDVDPIAYAGPQVDGVSQMFYSIIRPSHEPNVCWHQCGIRGCLYMVQEVIGNKEQRKRAHQALRRHGKMNSHTDLDIDYEMPLVNQDLCERIPNTGMLVDKRLWLAVCVYSGYVLGRHDVELHAQICPKCADYGQEKDDLTAFLVNKLDESFDFTGFPQFTDVDQSSLLDRLKRPAVQGLQVRPRNICMQCLAKGDVKVGGRGKLPCTLHPNGSKEAVLCNEYIVLGDSRSPSRRRYFVIDERAGGFHYDPVANKRRRPAETNGRGALTSTASARIHANVTERALVASESAAGNPAIGDANANDPNQPVERKSTNRIVNASWKMEMAPPPNSLGLLKQVTIDNAYEEVYRSELGMIGDVNATVLEDRSEYEEQQRDINATLLEDRTEYEKQKSHDHTMFEDSGEEVEDSIIPQTAEEHSQKVEKQWQQEQPSHQSDGSHTDSPSQEQTPDKHLQEKKNDANDNDTNKEKSKDSPVLSAFRNMFGGARNLFGFQASKGPSDKGSDGDIKSTPKRKLSTDSSPRSVTKTPKVSSLKRSPISEHIDSTPKTKTKSKSKTPKSSITSILQSPIDFNNLSTSTQLPRNTEKDVESDDERVDEDEEEDDEDNVENEDEAEDIEGFVDEERKRYYNRFNLDYLSGKNDPDVDSTALITLFQNKSQSRFERNLQRAIDDYTDSVARVLRNHRATSSIRKRTKSSSERDSEVFSDPEKAFEYFGRLIKYIYRLYTKQNDYELPFIFTEDQQKKLKALKPGGAITSPAMVHELWLSLIMEPHNQSLPPKESTLFVIVLLTMLYHRYDEYHGVVLSWPSESECREIMRSILLLLRVPALFDERAQKSIYKRAIDTSNKHSISRIFYRVYDYTAPK